MISTNVESKALKNVDGYGDVVVYAKLADDSELAQTATITITCKRRVVQMDYYEWRDARDLMTMSHLAKANIIPTSRLMRRVLDTDLGGAVFVSKVLRHMLERGISAVTSDILIK